MLTPITNINNMTSRMVSFKESDADKTLYDQIGQITEDLEKQQAKQAQKIQKRNTFIKNYRGLWIAGLFAIGAAFGYFVRPLVISDENERIRALNSSLDSKKSEMDSLNRASIANYDEFEKQTVERQHKIDSLDKVLLTKQNGIAELVERENTVNNLNFALTQEKEDLAQLQKQLDAKERELKERENKLKTKENESSKVVAETNPPKKVNTTRKVNKVLNTGEYGNLSYETLALILNNQQGEERFKYKNGKLKMKAPIWGTINNPPKTRLKRNESINLPMVCHYGDKITVGRTIDGLYWAENYCIFGLSEDKYNIYTESGQPINQRQKIGLYRTNVLATLQGIGKFSEINTNLFASVLASMDVFEIESDEKNGCIYCKTRDRRGLKITYNVKDKNVDGNIIYFNSFDEAKFSSQPFKTLEYNYKEDVNNSSVAVFTQNGMEQIFKAEGDAVYENGSKIIE